MRNFLIPFLCCAFSFSSLEVYMGELTFQEDAIFKVINDEDESDVYCLGEGTHLMERAKSAFEWNLAIATVFQDEAEWLKEWIEYHKLVGVEHFFLYNNLSTDDFLAVLKPYIDSKEVELIDWPHTYQNGEAYWIKVQTDAITDAITRSKESTKWLAIIDADEFLVPVKHGTMTDLLKAYEAIVPKLSQVCIKWVMFGTSDVLSKPNDRLMIETMTKNAGRRDDALYKSIVKPKDVIECLNTHYCTISKRKREEHVDYDYAQINHYWTRDELYLNTIKVPRREKIGYTEEAMLSWAASYNHVNEEGALPIRRFIGMLRVKMGMQ